MIISSMLYSGEGDGEIIKTKGEYIITFIDYDGTIIKQQRGDTGDEVTLPNNPTQPGLTFQEWCSPVAITDNKVTVTDNDITIGAVYRTTDGKSRFYRTTNHIDGLTTELNLNKTGIGTMMIDWGDGTSDSYATTGAISATHTYDSYGDYVQTVIFGGNYKIASYCTGANAVYNLTKVHLSEYVTELDNNAFYEDASLLAISIPNSVTTIGAYAFRYCRNLRGLVVPPRITYLTGYFANYCQSMNYIALGLGLERLGIYVFGYCYLLKTLSLPSTITDINTSCFSYLTNVKRIKFSDEVMFSNSAAYRGCHGAVELDYTGASMIQTYCYYQCFGITKIDFKVPITSIQSNSFYQCYAVMEYDFSACTEVPTLINVNAFSGINGNCKIKVPSSLYNDWILATNWTNYVDYIVEV